MPWDQRLKEAAYTSPSAKRMVFTYENVSKVIEKKTTAFDFPDANGTYIQDLGHTGRTYPLRVIFWGDDHDLQADDFEQMLSEKGAGRLEHPMYGVINVVPFGKITRRDDLKTAANQTVFTMTFWETIDTVFPQTQDDAGSAINVSLDAYNAAKAVEFDELLSTATAIEKSNFRTKYQTILDTATSTLDNIANAQAGVIGSVNSRLDQVDNFIASTQGTVENVQKNVKQQYDSIKDSINNGIDVLIDDVETLAFQTEQLIQTPARAVGSIIARLNGYGDLIDEIINGDDAIKTPGFDSQNSNDFHTADLFASTYISGAIVAVLNHQYDTNTNAIRDAERILNKFDELTDWRDANFESLEEIDTGESYQKLQESVALTVGFLTELSFNLAQEKSIVIDRNRTIVDLCGELYGVIDEQLDFMITSNNMNGDSIIELVRGQEIVYFL